MWPVLAQRLRSCRPRVVGHSFVFTRTKRPMIGRCRDGDKASPGGLADNVSRISSPLASLDSVKRSHMKFDESKSWGGKWYLNAQHSMGMPFEAEGSWNITYHVRLSTDQVAFTPRIMRCCQLNVTPSAGVQPTSQRGQRESSIYCLGTTSQFRPDRD